MKKLKKGSNPIDFIQIVKSTHPVSPSSPPPPHPPSKHHGRH